MPDDRTTFYFALRPFSLVVAVATCALGITLAFLDGNADAGLAALVILAGVMLQAGVNLINDYPDLEHERFSPGQRAAIVRNTRVGAVFIAMACLIGLWFVWLRGWPMLALGAVGVFGAWSYADGPINFKARGLGVVAVFFLTGVLMVEGAYFAMSGYFTLHVAWLSLPFSLYASLLLLANELRDYECDVSDGHRTFTVRAGYQAGATLYRALAAVLLLLNAVLAMATGTWLLVLPLLSLLALWLPLRNLALPARERAGLARLTGRCYALYALLFVAVLWVPAP